MVLWFSQEYLYDSECKDFGFTILHFEPLLIKSHRNQEKKTWKLRQRKEFCASLLEHEWTTNSRKNVCIKKIGVEHFNSKLANMKNSWKTVTRNFQIPSRTLWKYDFFCCCLSLLGRSGLMLQLNYFHLISRDVNCQVNKLSLLLSPKHIHSFHLIHCLC